MIGIEYSNSLFPIIEWSKKKKKKKGWQELI